MPRWLTPLLAILLVLAVLGLAVKTSLQHLQTSHASSQNDKAAAMVQYRDRILHDTVKVHDTLYRDRVVKEIVLQRQIDRLQPVKAQADTEAYHIATELKLPQKDTLDWSLLILRTADSLETARGDSLARDTADLLAINRMYNKVYPAVVRDDSVTHADLGKCLGSLDAARSHSWYAVLAGAIIGVGVVILTGHVK